MKVTEAEFVQGLSECVTMDYALGSMREMVEMQVTV